MGYLKVVIVPLLALAVYYIYSIGPSEQEIQAALGKPVHMLNAKNNKIFLFL